MKMEFRLQSQSTTTTITTQGRERKNRLKNRISKGSASFACPSNKEPAWVSLNSTPIKLISPGYLQTIWVLLIKNDFSPYIHFLLLSQTFLNWRKKVLAYCMFLVQTFSLYSYSFFFYYMFSA